MSTAAGLFDLWLSLVARLLRPIGYVVRWSEPYDYEDDDPFVDHAGAMTFNQPTHFWS